MYNKRVFIYTLFYGKGKALGFFMLQNVVVVFFSLLFYFCLEKIYGMFKMTAEWNIAFPVK